MLHLSAFSLIEQYGVFIVAVLILLGEMGIPTGISAEVALMLAGAYAVHSLPELIAAIALIAAADLIGTTALFFAARTGGNHLLSRLLKRFNKTEPASLERWRQRLGRHESRVVFLVRLLPLVRMYIAITTGLMRVRARAYVVGAAPAALVWVGLPLIAGFALRANVQQLQARYASYSHLLFLLSPLVGAMGALIWWIRGGAPRAERIRRVRLVAGLTTAFAGLIYLATSTWVLDRAAAHGEALIDPDRIGPWLMALAASVLLLLISGAGDLRLRAAGFGTLTSGERARFAAIGGWRTLITTAAMLSAIVLVISLERQFGIW